MWLDMNEREAQVDKNDGRDCMHLIQTWSLIVFIRFFMCSLPSSCREYLTFMRPLEKILETHGIFPVSGFLIHSQTGKQNSHRGACSSICALGLIYNEVDLPMH